MKLSRRDWLIGALCAIVALCGIGGLLVSLLLPRLFFYLFPVESEPLSNKSTSNFQDNPCIPPCWYGLTPGYSTLVDVRRILPSLSFIATETLKEVPSEDGTTSFYWIKKRRLSSDLDYLIVDAHGIVISIGVMADPPNDLQTFIASIGNPQKLFRFIGTGEEITYSLSFYYPKIGLVLTTAKLKPSQLPRPDCINPEISITRVEYHVVESSTGQQIYWSSVFDGHQDVFLPLLRDWIGLCAS